MPSSPPFSDDVPDAPPPGQGGQQTEKLFYEESDEEEEMMDQDHAPLPTQVKQEKADPDWQAESGSDSEIEVITPKHQSLTSRGKAKGKSKSDAVGQKRKMAIDSDEGEEARLSRPNRLDPRTILSEPGGYIGELIVQGFSLSKGKGYCTPGSKVILVRVESKAPPPEKTVKGKGSQQQSVKSMFAKKAAATSNAKDKPVKPNLIVRFSNEAGFEIGRIPQETADWLAPLIDLHLVHFAGTVIDCKVPLERIGDPILLSLKVYLRPEAFEEVERSTPTTAKNKVAGDGNKFGGVEKETASEKKLGTRKAGLLSLFKKVNLSPRRSSHLSDQAANTYDEMAKKHAKRARSQSVASSSTSGRSVSPVKRDLKGKGKATAAEEDEEEDDEGEGKLEEEELDTIYSKAQKNDKVLTEAEPAPTFSLTLRPYQKQALHWMSNIELGVKSGREATMHPLWEEYVFLDPDSKAISIEDDDEAKDGQGGHLFYFNPYSGELTLEFPTQKLVARGGILADSMGMGKTLMMASLIHTNRDSTDLPIFPDDLTDSTQAAQSAADEPSSSKRVRRQLTLDSSFRPKKVDLSDEDEDEEENSDDERPRRRKTNKKKGPTATLVVCPVSLLHQWKDELDRSAKKGSLRVVIYHGASGRDEVLASALEPSNPKKADVIITSYGVLQKEHEKWSERLAKRKISLDDEHGLFNTEWLRVVLDEAHNIKSRVTKAAHAAYAVNAQRRWCLTGTPIVNRLEDLHSLLAFLRIAPWGDAAFFRSFITIPFQNKDPSSIAVVQYILESCLLRREKTMRDRDGKLIVELPPKTVEFDHLEFSVAERQIYDRLYRKTQRKYKKFASAGTVGKHYSQILSMLMKLRQAALHPALVKISEDSDDSDSEDADDASDGLDVTQDLETLRKQFDAGEGKSRFPKAALEAFLRGEHSECAICIDAMDSPAFLPCGHSFCRLCVVNHFDIQHARSEPSTCPTCSRPSEANDLLEPRSGPASSKKNLVDDKFDGADAGGIEGGEDEAGAGVGATGAEGSEKAEEGGDTVLVRRGNFKSSTKLDALLRHLTSVEKEEPNFKALVFSHFTSFLDIIEKLLHRSGYAFLRLDGSLSIKDRAFVLSEFARPTKKPLIFLISVKAGGVGINLTSANYVYLMDLWWNESVEAQAIDRCHRLGQTRPVSVHKLIVSSTIEGRILEIQKRKTAIVDSSLGGGDQKVGLQNLELMFGE